MSDYLKSTNFAIKDSLPTGNSGKVIKGTEIDTEFNSIASAVSSKADTNSPALTGTPTAPTASAGTNTTQLATCAFVLANTLVDSTAKITDGVVTFAKLSSDAGNAKGVRTISTSAPSGGSSGDIWYKV